MIHLKTSYNMQKFVCHSNFSSSPQASARTSTAAAGYLAAVRSPKRRPRSPDAFVVSGKHSLDRFRKHPRPARPPILDILQLQARSPIRVSDAAIQESYYAARPAAQPLKSIQAVTVCTQHGKRAFLRSCFEQIHHTPGAMGDGSCQPAQHSQRIGQCTVVKPSAFGENSKLAGEKLFSGMITTLFRGNPTNISTP